MNFKPRWTHALARHSAIHQIEPVEPQLVIAMARRPPFGSLGRSLRHWTKEATGLRDMEYPCLNSLGSGQCLTTRGPSPDTTTVSGKP